MPSIYIARKWPEMPICQRESSSQQEAALFPDNTHCSEGKIVIQKEDLPLSGNKIITGDKFITTTDVSIAMRLGGSFPPKFIPPFLPGIVIRECRESLDRDIYTVHLCSLHGSLNHTCSDSLRIYRCHVQHLSVYLKAYHSLCVSCGVSVISQKTKATNCVFFLANMTPREETNLLESSQTSLLNRNAM